jgi:SAM-dependent methyltransferase
MADRVTVRASDSESALPVAADASELPRLREVAPRAVVADETRTLGGGAIAGLPRGMEGADDLEALEALLPGDEIDYIERNRVAWERWAPAHAAAGREAWREKDLRWGIWGVPESGLRILEDLEPGATVIELGCGTAVVSSWLARRGFLPFAVDIASAQLTTAKALQQEFGVSFPLRHANAEQVMLEDVRFDLAISEYGASLWCDPRRWLAEARRLLRLDGRLVFFTNSAMLMACTPADGGTAGERLVRDYFSRSFVEFPGNGAVEFHLTHGHWVRLLRANGFELENLIEVRPPPKAKPARFAFTYLEWARRWPSEEIWIARKTA